MKKMTKIWIMIGIICLLPAPIFAGETITEIFLVSEEWEGTCNKDGTGVYWDLFRMVYEPVGIQVNCKTMPYDTATEQVRKKEADAWVASYLDEADYALYPTQHFDTDIIQVIFKKGRVAQWRGEASLEGKKVGWVHGYGFDDYLDTHVRKVEAQRHRGLLMLLEKECIDFFMASEWEIDVELAKGEFDMTGYRREPVLGIELYPAFAKTEKGKRLKEIWDRRMAEMKDTEPFKQFYKASEGMHYPY